MPQPLGLNHSATRPVGNVRRSPRAPARVKVKFDDFVNDDVLKKKRNFSLTVPMNECPLIAAPGPKKTVGGREIDRYCWLCHVETEDTFCSRCPRIYHFQCLGPAHRFTEEGVCPECRQVSTDGTDLKDSLTVDKLSELLPYALNRMVANVPVIKTWKYSEKESKDLVCAMDLPTLLQNINEKKYKSTVSFLSDVKWILHNFTILHGSSHSITTSSKNFVKICRSEMLDIEACPDCYQHAYTLDDEKWFSQLCNVNHTLVWAKLKGFPFWPSKAVKVVDGIADVRFFGSHEKGRVPVGQCYHLSVDNPNDRPPKNANFKKALEELEMYIENVDSKFGPYQYYPPHTVYDPGSENHSLKQPVRKRTDTVHNALPSKSRKLKQNNQSRSKDGHVPGNSKKRPSDVGLKEKDVAKLQNGRNFLPSAHSKAKRNGRSSVENESSKKLRSNHMDQELSDAEMECVNSNKNKSKFMKHLELNNKNSSECHMVDITSVQSSTTVSEKCKLLISENNSEQSSSIQNSINSGSSISCIDVENDNENPADFTNGEPSFAVSLKKNCESSGGDSKVVSTSVSSESESSSIVVETVILSDEDKTLSSDSSSTFPVEQNTEYSNKASEIAVQDTVAMVIGSLEFYEEIPAAGDTNVLKQENVFIEDTSTMDISNDNRLSSEQVPSNDTDPTAVSTGLIVNEVQGVSNSLPPEISVNENAEAIGTHEPGMMFGVPINSAEAQSQQMCFIPLPQGPTLEKYQNKVYSLMRATVEEIWHDFVNTPNIQRVILSLQKEIEDLKRKHQQDISDITTNTDLILQDFKNSMEIDKQTAFEKMKAEYESEKQRAVDETKKKQWCANCMKEAVVYCCWNTSYCGHSCQTAHWMEHRTNCAQMVENDNCLPIINGTMSATYHNQSIEIKKKASQSVDKKFIGKQRNEKADNLNYMQNKDSIAPLNSAQHPFPPWFNYTQAQSPSLTSLKSAVCGLSSSKRTVASSNLSSRQPVQPQNSSNVLSNTSPSHIQPSLLPT